MPRHAPDSSETDTRPSRPIRGWQPIVMVLVVGIVLTSAPIGLVAGGGSTAGTVPVASDSNSSSPTENTLVVSDVTTDPNSSATHRVALTDVPEGLAGFQLTLALESDEVATVSGASYPDHFGMTTDPVVGEDDRTITVEAVDLADEITPDDSDVTLARIEVTGVDTGETELRVAELQVDADGGSPVEPILETGTVTVADGETASSSWPAAQSEPDDSETETDMGTGTDPDDSSESGADDSSDSVPGFTIALATIVVIAVGGLTARRT